MTGKELIKLIKDNDLEDFEIKVIFEDGYNVYPIMKLAELTGMGDIGHSNKVAYIEGDLEE